MECRLLPSEFDRNAVTVLREAATPTPAPTPPSLSPSGVGDLWTEFVEGVIEPLTPIVIFVAGFAALIFVAGRLLVLLGLFRDRVSFVWQRRVAWIAGTSLAIGIPLAFAVRGLWLMRGETIPGEPVPESPWLLFIELIGIPGWWWILVGGAALGVLLLAFGFATLQRTQITITSKEDGTGLDAPRIMTTINSMAGSPNRGLEYPVGTDVTTAADAVSKLSDNAFVAGFQYVVKVIFGTQPWTLAVENETSDALSIAVSRNGKLVKAKRLSLGYLTGYAELEKPSKAMRLASLVAAEYVALLGRQYPGNLQRGLHGATDPSSIALHYVASSEMHRSPDNEQKWAPILQEAIARDPANRAAVSTLRYVECRRATGDRLVAYRDELLQAAETERRYGIRDNDLYVRTLQSLMAAERNVRASNPAASAEVDFGELGELASTRRRNKNPDALACRRRMLYLITRFIGAQPGADIPPAGLEPEEQAVWSEARAHYKPGKSHQGTAHANEGAMLAAEEAVLARYGDFRNSPEVSYSLACRRVRDNLHAVEYAGVQSVEQLLTTAFRRPDIRGWAPDDPELHNYDRRRLRHLIDDSTPKPAESEPEPEELPYRVLIKRLLAKLAKS